MKEKGLKLKRQEVKDVREKIYMKEKKKYIWNIYEIYILSYIYFFFFHIYIYIYI